MRFGKKEKTLGAGFGILLAATLAFSSFASLALFVATSKDTGTYPGIVDLRSYFQKGTGKETDPFVISRPLHFYNLTRLQNIGVFNSKTYFSLGYDPTKPDDYDGSQGANLQFYESNTSDNLVDTLNMGDMSGEDSPYKMLSIGSEGAPFYGIFEGNKKTVVGLHVHSGPDDVGVFGYTFSGSSVQNVCFQNLQIYDDGYSNNESLNQAAVYAQTDATLAAAHAAFVYNGSPTVTFNTSANQTLTTFSKETMAAEPSFTFTCPDAMTGITYDFRSSSEYYTVVNNNDGTFTATLNRASADTDSKKCIENNADFYPIDGSVVQSRFSLIANAVKDGVTYSHVILTFKVSATSKVVSSTDHEITLKGIEDYKTSDTTDTNYDNYTQYAHGVNIGFLIGHCDGSAKNCFIYDGSLNMNTTTTGVTNIAQESDTGLIGEVGVSIKNESSPEEAYLTAGDTGVVNFTKLYSDIAINSNGTSVNFGSFTNGNTTYYTYYPVGGSSNIFAKYLRVDGSTANNNWGNGITNAENSIDFAGRQTIQDEASQNRNLGVFSLITSNHDTSTSPADQYTLGMGEFNVSHRTSNAFNEIYYTTAELTDESCSTVPYDVWGYRSDALRIQLGTTMPTYSDEHTWNPNLERYYNYIVRIPLNGSSFKNYFYNTTGFMKDYFSYKLVGKAGSAVEPGSKDFGVFVKNVDLTKNKTESIASFDAALKLSASTNNNFSTIDTAKKNPANSIDFSVKSEYGANVTVIAASSSGTGGYVSIYDKGTKGLTNGYAHKPSYTMYLPYTTGIDDFCYFDYDYGAATNPISSKAKWSSCGEKLFAHTFKVPKGDYFITSPTGSANIYYVCAQGQEGEGNTGNLATAFSQINTLDNVDFVDTIPTSANFSDTTGTWGRCFLSFQAKFDATNGSLGVSSVASGSYPQTTITKGSNLTYLLGLNDYLYPVVFNGKTYNTKFFTYGGS